jgi:hypothetical protein
MDNQLESAGTKVFSFVVTLVLGTLIYVMVGGAFTWLLWPVVVHLGLPVIGYWQGVSLFFLSNVLFSRVRNPALMKWIQKWFN